MTGKKEDLVVITKSEYEAFGRELAKLHMISLRYQARCTCNIDFEDLLWAVIIVIFAVLKKKKEGMKKYDELDV